MTVEFYTVMQHILRKPQECCIQTISAITSGYQIYVHCPFNYCKPPTSKMDVNLNVRDGADVQCANGCCRHGDIMWKLSIQFQPVFR